MQATKSRTSILRVPAVQTLLASLVCILLGLLVGYVALLIINPAGATEAILSVLKNFWAYSKPEKQLKNFGVTLVTTAPLLMCSLSVLFAYKVGLFNIGAAGQYVAGAGASLYCALALHLPWYLCVLAAILAAAKAAEAPPRPPRDRRAARPRRGIPPAPGYPPARRDSPPARAPAPAPRPSRR